MTLLDSRLLASTRRLFAAFARLTHRPHWPHYDPHLPNTANSAPMGTSSRFSSYTPEYRLPRNVLFIMIWYALRSYDSLPQRSCTSGTRAFSVFRPIKETRLVAPLVSENFDRNFIRLLLSLPQGNGPGNLGNVLTAAKYTSYLSQPQSNNISVQHRQQSQQSHPLDTPQVQRGGQPQPQMSIMWDQVKQDGGAWFECLTRKDQSTRESSANLGPQDRPHYSVR